MNESKHTPGPWETGSLRTNIEHWPEGWNAPVIVADCHAKHGSPETSAERVANALLIAAAPVLFAALQECITDDAATCFAASEAAFMAQRLKAINEIARAAIAKATGA